MSVLYRINEPNRNKNYPGFLIISPSRRENSSAWAGLTAAPDSSGAYWLTVTADNRLREKSWPESGLPAKQTPTKSASFHSTCLKVQNVKKAWEKSLFRMRMPSHPVVQQVIKASGVAFAAPSANLSGKPSPTNAPDTLADMDGRLPLILDGGESNVGVESTVVAVTGEHPMLLRPGYITKEQMEAVLGEEVLVSPAILEKLGDGEVARSPGMKYKHYAPKAQVTILRGDFAKYKEFIKQHTEPGVWALCFDGEGAQLGVPFIEYGKNHDGVTQAHHLFTALRDLDKHGAQVVYARCPEQDGVSMAVYNRLIRAAAFRVVEL